MVRTQLAARDVRDRRVLATMARIPRGAFVPTRLHPRAYEDGPLPIGHGQTISQPYIVGLMTQLARLSRRHRVLEVGTGCGYQTAVLAGIAAHVWTIERIDDLSRQAAARLGRLGIENVTFVTGDGALGYEPAAPYDAIVVTAAAPAPPDRLLAQLAVGARVVIPIGSREVQTLQVLERRADGVRTTESCAVRFVPLVSPSAFPD